MFCKSTMSWWRRWLEIALVAGYFLLLVHLLTGPDGGLVPLLASGALSATVWSWSWSSGFPERHADRRLWAVVSGLGSGLCLFALSRRLGWVDWPLQRPGSLAEYALLLCSHVALIAVTAAGLVWSLNSPRFAALLSPFRLARWGAWPRRGMHLLWAPVVVCWGWAGWYVLSRAPHVDGAVGLLAIIALTKAALTGVGEEFFYRGVLQSVCTARFGVCGGILCQALLYTLFHVHLGAALVGNHSAFLGAVFVLGVLFGAVTHRAQGIGWACCVHTSLDVLVEWSNLS
ncbi:MAG: CPBP family intramembrane metalloprotease [Nitrospiraceae bacterium]|nr:CPBP family intramembrane metalloprotease [Nitrospiraceae bacterium]